MYRQYLFNGQKPWEAMIKVKETDPICSQICSSLLQSGYAAQKMVLLSMEGFHVIYLAF